MTPERAAALFVVLAAASTFLPARRVSHADAPAPTKGAKAAARVGLVFDVGGRGDKSFNDSAYLGLMRAKSELGIDVSFLEPAGAEDREAALRLFASRGMDLVIGVGFIFTNDIDTVAADYPNVRFACVDYASPSPPPNVEGLVFREEEGSFLVGAAAGLLTKTGQVGFVGGMITPLIRKFETGYEAGVHATCPACVVHSAYAGATPDAFKDPSKGKALAINQISAGADVLYHASGATGHGVFEAARDAHVLAIGVDSDQHDEMPGTIVTSMVKRVDVTVLETVRAVVEHRFAPGLAVFGVKERGIDWIHEGPNAKELPDGVVTRVEELRADIVAGRVRVPAK